MATHEVTGRRYIGHNWRAELHADGDVVVVFDESNIAGGPTVTNNAEAVVYLLHTAFNVCRHMRIIYRDTEGVFDELQHNGRGQFWDFAPLREPDLERAVERVRPK